MKLTRPKSATSNPNLYYVSSESGDDKHIVVRLGNIWFCDCKNFMVSRLPKLGTPGFEFCKHGSFASRVVESTPTGVELLDAIQDQGSSRFVATGTSISAVNPVIESHKKQAALLAAALPKQPKKFKITLLSFSGHDLGRSSDLPKTYWTKAGAQKAIDKHVASMPHHKHSYRVDPL